MPDPIVKEALETFEEASEAESDNRKTYREDIEFALLDKQWPKDIEAQRKSERRPCLTLNKLGPVIRQVVNDARQNRPSTSVRPLDSGADPKTAEVLTGLIRSIESYSNADVAYDTAVQYAVAGGFGYWRINLDYAMNAVSEEQLLAAGPGAFEQDICLKSVPNPLNVYGDPYATDGDSANWDQAHVVEVLKGEQFKKKYPGAAETDFGGVEWQSVKEPWRDGDDVQVAEYWKREESIKNAHLVQMPDGEPIIAFEDDLQDLLGAGGTIGGQPRPVKTYKVKQYVVSGVEMLSELDWPGVYIPIVSVMGEEVNLEGKRYLRSLIRPAKDAARNYNYWNTTMTEVIALAPRVPYIGEEGSFDVDVDKWQTANSHSHSYIQHKRGTQKPERQPFSSIPTGMMQVAMTAADDIKAITGIYDASLGARSNETSGKAIMARQREGDVSTFHFIDNLTRAIRHSGRIMVDLIPKVYSTERIVRILGEDGKSKEAPLNQPYEDQGVLRINDVRTGRYDVAVKAGPSFTSRREEAAEQMMQWAQALGPEVAKLFGDLIAENLDWQGADKIAKRMKSLLPPGMADEEEGGAGIPPEVQQQMQQMAEALQTLKAELDAAQADNDIKREELAIKRFEAETDRIEVLLKAQQPTELPQEAAAPQFGQAA